MLANQIAVKQGQKNKHFWPRSNSVITYGQLIEIASLILSRADRMLQGLELKVM